MSRRRSLRLHLRHLLALVTTANKREEVSR
ncbi:hypothetical protein T458_06875 [Brevibacillus panacihumi W25]|uniref:Uncharacterized protein n=1 Tax=Brevibacillus panacihumi W25 TaxID=1408254 RepID=V6MCQ4_9BACL|nr:hypothetical protein T458_06875 [Brevibacillus panacihumi W25]